MQALEMRGAYILSHKMSKTNRIFWDNVGIWKMRIFTAQVSRFNFHPTYSTIFLQKSKHIRCC